MNQINLHNLDCLEFMRGLPDRAYELAIVDPPYYDNAENIITPGGRISSTGVARSKKYHMREWKAPRAGYFKELLRVSKNQIIWGVNYFNFPLPGGRIVWDKKNDNGGMLFSHCELAYCSMIGKRTVIFRYLWSGMLRECMKRKEVRIHPTQKPVALYKWLLDNYAKPGDRILDTHLGSGSIAIACHDRGFALDGCEIDPDYYAAAVERLERRRAQGTFDFEKLT